MGAPTRSIIGNANVALHPADARVLARRRTRRPHPSHRHRRPLQVLHRLRRISQRSPGKRKRTRAGTSYTRRYLGNGIGRTLGRLGIGAVMKATGILGAGIGAMKEHVQALDALIDCEDGQAAAGGAE